MRKVIISHMLLILMWVTAGGCVYKIDIQQGNSLEMDQINSVREGMTKQQVVFVLGTPLIQDPFEQDRWDYVYTFRPGGGEMRKEHLTLFFDNDKLIQIRKSPHMKGSDVIRKEAGRF